MPLTRVRNIWVFFLLSFPQNERKMYQFCSVSIFFEGSVFTFQFLNDEIHNYGIFDIGNCQLSGCLLFQFLSGFFYVCFPEVKYIGDRVIPYLDTFLNYLNDISILWFLFLTAPVCLVNQKQYILWVYFYCAIWPEAKLCFSLVWVLKTGNSINK